MKLNDFLIDFNNFYDFEVKKKYKKIIKITDLILKKERCNKFYLIEVNFIDDKTIKKINNHFRNINKTTDVISLSFLQNSILEINNKKYVFLGEIDISIDHVKKQAQKYKNTFFYELFFLYIHGLLHLLGYDHTKLKDAKIMMNKHKEILEKNKWLKKIN
ncbi:MAG: rRNA maturation RNase YbeY [Bacilli bacterium]|nr:rRNA maturation RNase YbeY [Bacilli bacterium]